MRNVRAKSQRRQQWPLVGGFRYVARDDHWEWSDEVAHMHGYEPGTVTPTTALVLSHKHPDDRPTVAELIEQVRRYGVPFSGRHRIIDTGGDEHVVIVVGDLFYDDDGAPAGTSGFYVDITKQLNTDVQQRLSEAMTAVAARRAVIDQALGMVMLRFHVDAGDAFQLLTKLSQDLNIKLRTIAECLASDIPDRERLLDMVSRDQ